MKNVLLIDDSKTVLNALKIEIEAIVPDANILLADSYKKAVDQIRKNQGNIAVSVVDIHLPDCRAGQAVLLTNSHKIPTIVLTADEDELLKKLVTKKDVLDYIRKSTPNSISYAASFVKQIFRNFKKNILLVDDSKVFRDSFRNFLHMINVNVIEATNGLEALEIFKAYRFDIHVVLTDYNMPKMDGLELIEALRKTHKKDKLAIIAISATDNPDALPKFLRAGANDFINKPTTFDEIQIRINSALDLLDLFAHTRDMANRDFLTSLYNRRYFFEHSQKMFDNAREYGKESVVATVDIDKFKSINDTYGHDVGDMAIKESAKILRNTLHYKDLIARFGGEEFCIILHNSNAKTAREVFEKVRVAFESHTLELAHGKLHFSVSIGVAHGKNYNIDEMLKMSDKALYNAKESGRNKVVMYEVF
jgi:diguanylate cyclase (GGDEF)-like protein